MSEGYELISTDPARAISLFKTAAEMDPSNYVARRQLGYLFAASGDHAAALEEFGRAEMIVSSDTVQLQMAFSLLAIGEVERGKSLLFTLGTTSDDPDIRESASTALNVAVGVYPGHPREWGHTYASPYYDSRWKSFIGYISTHRGLFLDSQGLLSAFVMLQASGDSKSRGGTIPEIFSDNSILAAAGIRITPWSALHLDIQQGLAYDLVREGDGSRFRGDFRAAAVFGTGIYPEWQNGSSLRYPFSPLLDIYSSVGYYSRFNNVIGYLQCKPGVRWLEADAAAIDAYGRLFVAADASREFYNNIIEWGGGLRITPVVGFGVFLDLEYVRGRYYSPVDDLPYASSYDAFRAFLIFEHSF